MDYSKVSVIIPAYNEEESISQIVKEIIRLYPGIEILVVNDGSEDDTASAASTAGAIVYNHPYNIGNGAAIKTGIRNACREILVFMDGDGQHQPEDISRLLSFLPDYDMAVGARSKGKHASFGRALGNRIYNLMASYVAKFQVRDLTSGFRAVKSNIARSLVYLLPNTYSYPTTITLSVLRRGLSVKYVPIDAGRRITGKSNIRLVRDGIRFFMIIAKICTLYSPMRIFLPVSAGAFLLGVGYYGYTYAVSGRFTNMSALLFTTSIIIFMLGLISEQINQMRFDRSENENICS